MEKVTLHLQRIIAFVATAVIIDITMDIPVDSFGPFERFLFNTTGRSAF